MAKPHVTVLDNSATIKILTTLQDQQKKVQYSNLKIIGSDSCQSTVDNATKAAKMANSLNTSHAL